MTRSPSSETYLYVLMNDIYSYFRRSVFLWVIFVDFNDEKNDFNNWHIKNVNFDLPCCPRSGSIYGPAYLLDEDVILVTLNYRLGAIGFLSTGDDAASGNAALKDMVKIKLKFTCEKIWYLHKNHSQS